MLAASWLGVRSAGSLAAAAAQCLGHRVADPMAGAAIPDDALALFGSQRRGRQGVRSWLAFKALVLVARGVLGP